MDSGDSSMFVPVRMRILPAFTQVKDWTHDGRADGIEVLVEFLDQFSDPTKASGKLIFELFEFQTGPDSRGRRISNPWIGSLASVGDQRQHWDSTSRAYSFFLAYAQVNPAAKYVLAVSFEPPTGDRQFDQVVVEPRQIKAR